MKMKVATFEINDYLGHAFTCDCGKQHTTRLEHVRVCDHVKEDILKYLQEHAYHTVYMIEDENTCRVYGEELEAYLNANGIASDRVILEADVVPNEASVFRILVNMKRQYDYILGVGSGTLNDLCKFISYKLSLNYGIAATAPSMDGFASVGAALITDNLKTTYDCHVPTAIFGDLDVLANAPLDMIKAGLGDIVGKYNCLVDWKIAHMINGEYYCQTIVDMVYKSIKEVVAHADGVMTRDKAAVKAITEALIETGMAMGFVGNSRPASGSEHHVSHRKRVKAFDKAAWEAMVLDRFEAAVPGVLALEEKAGKNDIEAALKRIDIMEEKWPDIQAVIEQELPQPEEVTAILKSVEAPYRPMQVGIDEAMTRDGVILAKEVRVRYGLLQLLWDLGLLEDYSTAFVAYYRNN